MKQIETLSNIIKNRRSIFPPMYKEEKIEDETIELLLENANWAPTHKKTEPWRFHILTGESLNKFSQFSSDWYLNNTPSETYSPIKHKKKTLNPLKASHIIALCIQRDPSECIPEWEEIAALSMSVQNMWLSCTALGIGCYWSTPASINDADQILNLEKGEKCYGWFYLGIPQDDLNVSQVRSDISKKTKWYK